MQIIEYLSYQEALEYLRITPAKLNIYISTDEIGVGLMAKNWKGIAIPEPNQIKNDLKISLPQKANSENEKEFKITFTPKQRKRKLSQTVVECTTSQFWYLDNDTASLILNSIPSDTGCIFLRAYAPESLNKLSPEKFPFNKFLVLVEKNYEELNLSISDIYFIKADLESLKMKLSNYNETRVSNDFKFTLPTNHDEIAKIIQEYYEYHLEIEPNRVPTYREVFSLLAKNVTDETFYHDTSSNVIVFENVSGKRNRLSPRSLRRRLKEYVSIEPTE